MPNNVVLSSPAAGTTPAPNSDLTPSVQQTLSAAAAALPHVPSATTPLDLSRPNLQAGVRRLRIRVPASTANIGPGFDVLGIALSLFVTLDVSVPGPDPTAVIIEYHGNNAANVPKNIPENLITRVAAYVAAAHSTSLPQSMHIVIDNQIPLSRGLGSSGSAVVAGVLLGNAVCNLNLPHARLLDFANFIEGHPDNTTASFIGGFNASYFRSELTQSFSDVVLPNDSPKYNKNNTLPVCLPVPPKEGLGRYIQLALSDAVRAVVIIPQFELATKLARDVLPANYSRHDAVFNLQRLGVLTTALGQKNPDPELVYEGMQDTLHQKYRQHLVPGLSEILSLTPSDLPGLLGVAMSGAGPTVLALATDNFEQIGAKIKSIFAQHTNVDGKPIQSDVRILEIERTGVEIVEHFQSNL